MPSLPLFPLGTTLAPGGHLPLQVFEPRYVQLLADLLAEQDVRPPSFGVIAIRAGHEVGVGGARDLHAVGTQAVVVRAADVGDGRLLVVSVGERRFRLEQLDETTDTPYLTGVITWLDEPLGAAADVVDELTATLRRRTLSYLHQTNAEVEDEDLSHDPLQLSHQLGEVLGLDLGDRQRLLESVDTLTRMRLGLRLVQRERGVATAFGAVPQRPDHPFSLN